MAKDISGYLYLSQEPKCTPNAWKNRIGFGVLHAPSTYGSLAFRNRGRSTGEK